MGQYYMVANLDRLEYIHPHRLGSGLKLWEICAGNLPRVLAYLLRQSTGRGGGDPRLSYGAFEDDDGNVDWDAFHDAVEERYPYCGRWAGERVIIVGDYDESDRFGGLYREVQDSDEWGEISPEVAPEFNRFIESKDKWVKEPARPEECDHPDTWVVRNGRGEVTHRHCDTCGADLPGEVEG